MDYLDNNKLIGGRQFGFSSCMSADQLLLQSVNMRNLNKNMEHLLRWNEKESHLIVEKLNFHEASGNHLKNPSS